MDTTPAPVTIRKVFPTDLSLILDLIRELAEYERAPDEAIVTLEDLRDALFGSGPAAEAIIGSLDGDAVGFALFFHNFSTWHGKRGLFLEDLFVRPEARARGVGIALFRELARIAVARRCTRFEWRVLDWNDLAINFYKKLGAESLEGWLTFRLEGKALADVAKLS